MRRFLPRFLPVVLAVIGMLIAACTGTPGSAAKPPVIVGSTNFFEQVTLGELYAQVLEDAGYQVTRRFNLGNREVVFPALESGQIDILGEYLATALVFADKNATPTTDKNTTAAALRTALAPKNLTVLDPADATDQNGFVVTQATAAARNLRRISDLAAYDQDMVLGGPPECPQRAFCALGLRDKYGITFKEFKPLDAAGPLTVAALEGRQIDVGLLFTSDPIIVAKNFVLLEDDRQLQLADNVAPVVRNQLLSQDDGTITRLLNAVSARLTQGELNDMNKQVSVDRRDNAAVAKDWLEKQGLVK